MFKKAELEEIRYGLNHDIKAAINRALAFFELLESLSEEERLKQLPELLPFIKSSLKEGSAKTNAIHELFVIELSKNANEKIKLSSLLKNVLEEKQKENPHTEINWAGLEGLPDIKGNPDLIKKVFEELVSNSITNKQENSPLMMTLSSSQNKKNTIIRFENNSNPIKPGSESLITKLFCRLTPRKIGDPHYGAGLAIIKAIIKLHKGTFDVERLESGLAFDISFSN